MTTMTATILNHSYWNNNQSDLSFDFDDLFSSTYTFNHNNQYNDDSMSIKEEPKEISSLSSEVNILKNLFIKYLSFSIQIDQKPFQTSVINNPSKKIRLTNLKCAVCGAPATGYNFDQITCESCKAFFRRNALRDMVRILENSINYATI
jgi:nuclear receptor subfamily 1 group I